jgi:hypothetical protein
MAHSQQQVAPLEAAQVMYGRLSDTRTREWSGFRTFGATRNAATDMEIGDALAATEAGWDPEKGLAFSGRVGRWAVLAQYLGQGEEGRFFRGRRILLVDWNRFVDSGANPFIIFDCLNTPPLPSTTTEFQDLPTLPFETNCNPPDPAPDLDDAFKGLLLSSFLGTSSVVGFATEPVSDTLRSIVTLLPHRLRTRATFCTALREKVEMNVQLRITSKTDLKITELPAIDFNRRSVALKAPTTLAPRLVEQLVHLERTDAAQLQAFRSYVDAILAESKTTDGDSLVYEAEQATKAWSVESVPYGSGSSKLDEILTIGSKPARDRLLAKFFNAAARDDQTDIAAVVRKAFDEELDDAYLTEFLVDVAERRPVDVARAVESIHSADPQLASEFAALTLGKTTSMNAALILRKVTRLERNYDLRQRVLAGFKFDDVPQLEQVIELIGILLTPADISSFASNKVLNKQIDAAGYAFAGVAAAAAAQPKVLTDQQMLDAESTSGTALVKIVNTVKHRVETPLVLQLLYLALISPGIPETHEQLVELFVEKYYRATTEELSAANIDSAAAQDVIGSVSPAGVDRMKAADLRHDIANLQKQLRSKTDEAIKLLQVGWDPDEVGKWIDETAGEAGGDSARDDFLWSMLAKQAVGRGCEPSTVVKDAPRATTANIAALLGAFLIDRSIDATTALKLLAQVEPRNDRSALLAVLVAILALEGQVSTHSVISAFADQFKSSIDDLLLLRRSMEAVGDDRATLFDKRILHGHGSGVTAVAYATELVSQMTRDLMKVTANDGLLPAALRTLFHIDQPGLLKKVKDVLLGGTAEQQRAEAIAQTVRQLADDAETLKAAIATRRPKPSD